MEVGARIQAGTGRTTRCGVGPMVGEPHARGGQPVECWRLYDRVTGGRQAVPAPLVNRDEQHVSGHCPETTGWWRGIQDGLSLAVLGRLVFVGGPSAASTNAATSEPSKVAGSTPICIDDISKDRTTVTSPLPTVKASMSGEI